MPEYHHLFYGKIPTIMGRFWIKFNKKVKFRKGTSFINNKACNNIAPALSPLGGFQILRKHIFRDF